MIRSLHLTDIGALLLFLGKSPINEARSRDRPISRSGELLSVVPLLKSCLLSGDKQHSFIYFQRGFIEGVVCVCTCRGPSAWMVELLLLAPGREGVCADLLERLGFAGDKIKAERVFLRLDSTSPVADMAKQAGFNHHLTEFLYRLDDVSQVQSIQPSLGLRPKSSADDHGLFRLYNAATPVQVRRAEGMTLEEWSQSRDRDASRELVLESGGEISAWLRFRLGGGAGQFDIVTELGADESARLVNYSLIALKGRRPIYCLVPEFQQQLQRILEEQGFRQVASYLCLSKQLAVRVHEPQLVPLRA
jgi:hypothetical protein